MRPRRPRNTKPEGVRQPTVRVAPTAGPGRLSWLEEQEDGLSMRLRRYKRPTLSLTTLERFEFLEKLQGT